MGNTPFIAHKRENASLSPCAVIINSLLIRAIAKSNASAIPDPENLTSSLLRENENT